MSGNIKIHPELATGVANMFNQKATVDLESLISSLDSKVNSEIGDGKPAWEGQQAREFEQAWNSEFKPALKKLQTALLDAQGLLNKTIDAYRTLDS